MIKTVGGDVLIRKNYRLVRSAFLILLIFLPFEKAYPVDMDALYRDYLIQKMWIAKLRQSRGDQTAGSLLKDLSGEAVQRGIPMQPLSDLSLKKRESRKNRSALSQEEHSDKFKSLIHRAAGIYNLPPELIRAVIHAESSFVEDAVSYKGAQGLMQLMPETAEDLGVKNAFDPRANIFGGSYLLKRHLVEFGSLKKALIAYNAGPEWVRKGRGIPDETRKYIRKVLNYYHFYRTHP